LIAVSSVPHAIQSRSISLLVFVNVIAPLVTNETGVLRQSTYYPYSWALCYARGRVLDLRVESDTYRITADGLQADFARDASVPFVDLVATIDDAAGQAAVPVLNRDLDGDREVVRAAAARSARGGQPDDVQAAAALVHRGASAISA
jgi:alpha-N-arabinofuranosidase